MTTQVDKEESDDYQYVNGGSSHYRHLRRPDEVNTVQRERKVEPVETDASDDYQYIDIGDNHYMHLKYKREQESPPGNPPLPERYVEPLRSQSPPPDRPRESGPETAEITDNHNGCKRPPRWVWLLVVTGVLIVAAVLAAVLVLVLQDSPKQNTSESPNAGIPTGANCQAIYHVDYTTSGVYTISPDGVKKMDVYCEQELDGGGWMVFQRRFNGQLDFNKKWSEYREGFGDVSGEHWLGNDNIYILTAAGNQKLKIEMTHPNGTLAYADYSLFMIENEVNDYQLHVSGFTSRNPPGDALLPHDGVAFTTLDRDHDDLPDDNCAHVHPGGWWFTDCYRAHLNGVYNGTERKGIAWTPWTSQHESLLNVRMMMKTS